MDLSKVVELSVGQCDPNLISMAEGVQFDMTDMGAVLIYRFRRPSELEIKQFKESVQFGLFEKRGILFILSKFGSMEWTDAPYHVNLSINLTGLMKIDEGEGDGFGLTCLLVDSVTGMVHAIRRVGLSTRYSKALRDYIINQHQDNFDVIKYSGDIIDVMGGYTTNDMVKLSIVNCKFDR